jgi:hypothetical protein
MGYGPPPGSVHGFHPLRVGNRPGNVADSGRLVIIGVEIAVSLSRPS